MNNKVCQKCGETSEVWKYKETDFYYCKKHYHQAHYLERTASKSIRRRKNKYIIKGDYVEVHFNTGDIGFIDTEDLSKFNKYFWGLNSQGYAHSRINGVLKRLHLYLLDFPNRTVDHINRNKLDNRKANLRLCEQRENTRNLSKKKNNTSGFPGVNLIKKSGKWKARIMVDRKGIHIGHYDTFEEAVEARKKAEIKYFGEYAPNVTIKELKG